MKCRHALLVLTLFAPAALAGTLVNPGGVIHGKVPGAALGF